jgi:hypothetical protein
MDGPVKPGHDNREDAIASSTRAAAAAGAELATAQAAVLSFANQTPVKAAGTVFPDAIRYGKYNR